MRPVPRVTVLTAAALAAFLMPVAPAQAQLIPVICQPHKLVADKLLKEFDEVLVAHGLAGSRLLELYASRDGTFTVLLTRTDGLTCIQGAGTNFILTHNEYPKRGKPL